MLELKPNCELCDIDLAANSEQAYICSYECTFCKDCVDAVLINVCPNCSCGFCARPIRASIARREGVSLASHKASSKRVSTKYSLEDIHKFAAKHQSIPARKR